MLNIACTTAEQRRALFHNTAVKMGLTDAIVEKDFWACWTLDYLFCRSPWRKHLTFKGGTSLSKCYGLIKRFSEDIDLILDWQSLGYHKDEPWAVRSNTSQERFCKEMNMRTATFLAKELVPVLQSDFTKLLYDSFAITIDDTDPQTVNFDYPKCFQTSYVLNTIRLEIGTLAAWTPACSCEIKPYAAEQYRHLFKQPVTCVLTVAAERTFWEKATILHKEAFRSNGKFPERYSRHYYDIYCMAKSTVKFSALNNLPLLERVVDFKSRFYHSGTAHYELARKGTLRLMPPENCIQALRADYKEMEAMIFGERPAFEEMMEAVRDLEQELNLPPATNPPFYATI